MYLFYSTLNLSDQFWYVKKGPFFVCRKSYLRTLPFGTVPTAPMVKTAPVNNTAIRDQNAVSKIVSLSFSTERVAL